jgi:hypothetical protein
LVSASACTVSPVRVVVAPMSSTTTSWLVSGRPRQFIEMCANSSSSASPRYPLDRDTPAAAATALTPAQLPCLRAQQQPALALAQVRPQHRDPTPYRIGHRRLDGDKVVP